MVKVIRRDPLAGGFLMTRRHFSKGKMLVVYYFEDQL